METYQVKPGDSLSKISQLKYGDFSMVDEIARLNNIANINLIMPGQVLRLPTVTEAEVVVLDQNGNAVATKKKNWLPYLIGGLLVAGGIYYVINRKKSGKKVLGLGSVGTEKNPEIGEFVYDIYYNRKRKVVGKSGELYFIGPDHEPVRRHEFIFPLKNQKKKGKKAMKTYDIIFNDENHSNNKGFRQSLDYCRNYIKNNAGTDISYFEDYKNGTVSIYCNETEKIIEIYDCENGTLLERK